MSKDLSKSYSSSSDRNIKTEENTGIGHGYSVDQGCIGCGMCADVSPTVFRMDERGHADTDADPSAEKDPVGAAQAMAVCPVGAIEKT